MIYPITIILCLLWFLGLLSSYTLGGFIHVLLVIAVIIMLVGITQRRRPV